MADLSIMPGETGLPGEPHLIDTIFERVLGA
jgi:hypothetical protein